MALAIYRIRSDTNISLEVGCGKKRDANDGVQYFVEYPMLKVMGDKEMGAGKINVWIREPDDCTVSEMDGYAWARPCCARESDKIYQAKLKNGHAEIEDVPPGCYIVDASWRPGCCGDAKETMVIVDCGEMVCVNLIREWAGDPIVRISSLANHARDAKIPDEKVGEVVDLLVKIADTVPAGKVRRLTEKEFNIKRELSDEPHKKVLDKFERILKKQ